MVDRSTLLPALLAVAGALALIAAPGLPFQPHYGQAAYDLGVERADDVPPDADPVAFDDLSSGAQSAFLRGVSSDGRATLWVDDLGASDTVSALRGADYVKYDGGTYAVVRVSVARFGLGPAVGRALAVLSVTLLTVAGLMVYDGSDRPLTPLRALWVPLAPVAVTGAVALYDVHVAPPRSADLPIFLAATTWVVSGVYLRRRTLGLAAVAGVGAFAVDALLTRPEGAVAVAGIVAYGVPWTLLGATLAAPATADARLNSDPGADAGGRTTGRGASTHGGPTADPKGEPGLRPGVGSESGSRSDGDAAAGDGGERPDAGERAT